MYAKHGGPGVLSQYVHIGYITQALYFRINLCMHAQRRVTVVVKYVCLSVCAWLILETASRMITKL